MANGILNKFSWPSFRNSKFESVCDVTGLVTSSHTEGILKLIRILFPGRYYFVLFLFYPHDPVGSYKRSRIRDRTTVSSATRAWKHWLHSNCFVVVSYTVFTGKSINYLLNNQFGEKRFNYNCVYIYEQIIFNFNS